MAKTRKQRQRETKQKAKRRDFEIKREARKVYHTKRRTQQKRTYRLIRWAKQTLRNNPNRKSAMRRFLDKVMGQKGNRTQ